MFYKKALSKEPNFNAPECEPLACCRVDVHCSNAYGACMPNGKCFLPESVTVTNAPVPPRSPSPPSNGGNGNNGNENGTGGTNDEEARVDGMNGRGGNVGGGPQAIDAGEESLCGPITCTVAGAVVAVIVVICCCIGKQTQFLFEQEVFCLTHLPATVLAVFFLRRRKRGGASDDGLRMPDNHRQTMDANEMHDMFASARVGNGSDRSNDTSISRPATGDSTSAISRPSSGLAASGTANLPPPLLSRASVQAKIREIDQADTMFSAREVQPASNNSSERDSPLAYTTLPPEASSHAASGSGAALSYQAPMAHHQQHAPPAATNDYSVEGNPLWGRAQAYLQQQPYEQQRQFYQEQQQRVMGNHNQPNFY